MASFRSETAAYNLWSTHCNFATHWPSARSNVKCFRSTADVGQLHMCAVSLFQLKHATIFSKFHPLPQSLNYAEIVARNGECKTQSALPVAGHFERMAFTAKKSCSRVAHTTLSRAATGDDGRSTAIGKAKKEEKSRTNRDDPHPFRIIIIRQSASGREKTPVEGIEGVAKTENPLYAQDEASGRRQSSAAITKRTKAKMSLHRSSPCLIHLPGHAARHVICRLQKSQAQKWDECDVVARYFFVFHECVFLPKQSRACVCVVRRLSSRE